MDGGVGHTAWAPEGREGRSQAGPKGRQLEVGPRRGPRLLVYIFFCILKIGVFGRAAVGGRRRHRLSQKWRRLGWKSPISPRHLNSSGANKQKKNIFPFGIKDKNYPKNSLPVLLAPDWGLFKMENMALTLAWAKKLNFGFWLRWSEGSCWAVLGGLQKIQMCRPWKPFQFLPFLHSKNEDKMCKIQNLLISHPKVETHETNA